MRLGVALHARDRETLQAEARAAEAGGLDFCLVRDGPRRGVSGPALAATLAGVTQDLRVVVEIAPGGHPLSVAEELAVCDLLLQGRLAAVVTGRYDEVSETVDVLRRALAGRAVAGRGPRWRFPAEGGPGVVLTPAPAQLELPVWTALTCVHLPLGSDDELERAVARLSSLPEAGLCVVELDHDDPADRLDVIRRAGARLGPRLRGNDLPPDLVASWD